MQFIIKKTPNMEKYITAFADLETSANMSVAGQIAAYYIKQKVPTRTGALRVAYTIDSTSNSFAVDWGGSNALPYSRYQFYGRVYEINKAVFANGQHMGWVSPIKPKRPTERMMGTPAEIPLKDGRVIIIEGYHTPNTGPEWTDSPNTDMEISQPIQYGIGRYLYEQYCKATDTKPVGGFQVLEWAEKLNNAS
jgi:hypothetical protein